MTLRGTTSLLGVVVAGSSAAWNLHIAARANEVPFQWAPTVLALLPHAAATAAAILVLRASTWWRSAALTYIAAFAALEAVGLVQIWPFASQYETYALAWSVATSSLALVAAGLAVVALHRMDAEGDSAVSPLFRWTAVAGGLLLAASSLFAWSVSSTAPTGSWIFALSRASVGAVVGAVVGIAVVVGITAAVAGSSERSRIVGATIGLLSARSLALSVFADRTWQDADAMLVAGWWIALVAQVLLVVALVAFLGRGAARSRVARDLAPTA